MTSAQPQERCITLYRNLGVLSASHCSIDAIQSDILHSSLQTSCAYVHVRLTFPARFRHPSVPAMLPVISLTATTKKASKIPSNSYSYSAEILMTSSLGQTHTSVLFMPPAHLSSLPNPSSIAQHLAYLRDADAPSCSSTNDAQDSSLHTSWYNVFRLLAPCVAE